MYVPQFGKTDTLAADLDAGATTGTLTSGNFTAFTTDFLVVDYDVPAKREVIKCTVSGTAITAITRAQEGTSDVDHDAGAKVGYMFVPSHYGNGLGTIAENDAWTAWTATLVGFSGTPTQSNVYIQIGKIVIIRFYISGTSNANTFTVTLPVAPKYATHFSTGYAIDNGVALTSPGRVGLTAASTTVSLFSNMAGGTWAVSGDKAAHFTLIYEAE